jgi:AraC family transcriptional regulator
MVCARAHRRYSDLVTDPSRRDRLRELLDAVTDGGNGVENRTVGAMARSSHASEFHFSREVRRLTGESPAALRRRVMLERAAWRLQRGESVATVAAEEGWSSAEVFSRAFRRTYGRPPSQAAAVHFRLPAPNGLHFHPPQALWIDEVPTALAAPDVTALMIGHDLDDTRRLIAAAAHLSPQQWSAPIRPGQTVLDWDGPEPSVEAVLGAIVWSKQVWLATIVGHDFPARPAHRDAGDLAVAHESVGNAWRTTIADHAAAGRLGDTVIDALCDPPESFPLYGIVAHVLTYSAHRRELARAMLAEHGVDTGCGDPLDWMRS